LEQDCYACIRDKLYNHTIIAAIFHVRVAYAAAIGLTGILKKSYTRGKVMHKKGQIGKVGELILIIAGAIVMLLVLSKLTEKSTFDEAINTCRLSVIGQVATELKPGITGSKSPFDINCDRRYVKFYNTKVELGLSPTNMKARQVTINGKKVNKFSELTELTVDQVLAEEMRICKYQFADGKIEVFANDDSFWSGKYICFICSEVDFDPGVRRSEFVTLVEYTNKTTSDKTGTTYYDYLTEKSYTENILWSQPTYVSTNDYDKNYNNLTIDKSKKYYVFFEKYNPRTHIQALSPTDDVTKTNAYNVEQYWVAIVPADEINTYCNFQAS
jgi:hypothetical protein